MKTTIRHFKSSIEYGFRQPKHIVVNRNIKSHYNDIPSFPHVRDEERKKDAPSSEAPHAHLKVSYCRWQFNIK